MNDSILKDLSKFPEYVLEGFGMESQKQYSKAFDLYSKALDLKKDSPTVYIRRAYCGAKMGLVEDVVADLSEAVLLEPMTPTDYLTVGWFRATNPFPRYRDGPLAVALAQKSLEGRESIDGYDVLAAGYAAMGSYGKALDVLRMAVKKFPESERVSAINDRIVLFKQKKQFNEDWSAVEGQDPSRK
ncbi:MAG: hypothetical protein AAGA18_05450 [Verrucomicrobiota bacterium]